MVGLRWGRVRRREEEAAWLAASPQEDGGGEPVAVEVWWAGRDAGIVWEGRDVGVWTPTLDGPSNSPRLRPVRGGLVTALPAGRRRGVLG